MDALDLRLLEAMGTDPWRGDRPDPRGLHPAFLADATGATTETVRQRIARMEDIGVICGYEAYPEPGQLSLDVTRLHVDPPGEDTADIVDGIGLIDGVLEIDDLVGQGLSVLLGHRDEAERDRRTDAIAQTCRGPSPERLTTRAGDLAQRRLDRLDWRIVRELRGQGDRSLYGVADSVGRSYETVRQRKERMIEDGALVVAPVVDIGRVDGVVPVTLLLWLEGRDDPTAVETVRGFHADRQLRCRWPEEGSAEPVELQLAAASLAQVEELVDEAQALERVSRATVELTHRSYGTMWLDDRIDAVIDALAA